MRATKSAKTDPQSDAPAAAGLSASCSRQALVDALAVVEGWRGRTDLKPILGCIRVRAQGGQLDVAATDFDLGAVARVPEAQVLGEGVICVDAGDLVAIAEASESAQLLIESQADAGRCRIASLDPEVEEYLLLVRDAGDWPAQREPSGEPQLRIQAGALVAMAAATAHCAAREPGHRSGAINGVLAEMDAGAWTFVATDGIRMAAASAKPMAIAGEIPKVVLPPKMLRLLGRALPDPEAAVDVWLDARQIIVRSGGVTIGGGLIPGQWPRWRDLLERPAPLCPRISREDLARGLRRAATMTGRDSRYVDLAFAPGCLTLGARSDGPTTGAAPGDLWRGEAEARIRVPASYDGPDVTLAINPKYMLDALGALGARGEAEAALGIEAPDKPVRIRAQGYNFVVTTAACAGAPKAGGRR